MPQAVIPEKLPSPLACTLPCRYLFAKRRHKEGTQYEAAPLAGPLATPPAEGAAGTAASATTAQGAAMPAGGEVLEAKGQQKKLPADADEQTGAKNALLQAKPQKPLQVRHSSSVACVTPSHLTCIFPPFWCRILAQHASHAGMQHVMVTWKHGKCAATPFR
eukprot:scaffold12270_cov18-Tisochrysis_lutea.AAC.1